MSGSQTAREACLKYAKTLVGSILIERHTFKDANDSRKLSKEVREQLTNDFQVSSNFSKNDKNAVSLITIGQNSAQRIKQALVFLNELNGQKGQD